MWVPSLNPGLTVDWIIFVLISEPNLSSKGHFEALNHGLVIVVNHNYREFISFPCVCVLVCVCVCVLVLVCVCVCVHVCVNMITQDNSRNNGSMNLKLQHMVVYETSDQFDIGHCLIKVKVMARL